MLKITLCWRQRLLHRCCPALLRGGAEGGLRSEYHGKKTSEITYKMYNDNAFVILRGIKRSFSNRITGKHRASGTSFNFKPVSSIRATCGVVMHALPASIALGWLCPQCPSSAQGGTATGGCGHREILTSHR